MGRFSLEALDGGSTFTDLVRVPHIGNKEIDTLTYVFIEIVVLLSFLWIRSESGKVCTSRSATLAKGFPQALGKRLSRLRGKAQPSLNVVQSKSAGRFPHHPQAPAGIYTRRKITRNCTEALISLVYLCCGGIELHRSH